MMLRPARPEELPEAISILNGWLGPERDRAFQVAARNDWANCRVIVASEAGELRGAVLAEMLGRHSAMILPPRTIPEDRALEVKLVRGLLEPLVPSRVAHCFLQEDDRASTCLRQVGFTRITRLLQMRRTASTDNPPTGGSIVQLEEFSEDQALAFEVILRDSQRNSLDCPELFERLPADEILAGYRTSPPDRRAWFLARRGSQIVGIVMLTGDVLSYMGVVPAARGQGLGHAVLSAVLQRHPVASLAVDERNLPARSVYERAGFRVESSKEVWLYSAPVSAGGESVKLG